MTSLNSQGHFPKVVTIIPNLQTGEPKLKEMRSLAKVTALDGQKSWSSKPGLSCQVTDPRNHPATCSTASKPKANKILLQSEESSKHFPNESSTDQLGFECKSCPVGSSLRHHLPRSRATASISIPHGLFSASLALRHPVALQQPCCLCDSRSRDSHSRVSPSNSCANTAGPCPHACL